MAPPSASQWGIQQLAQHPSVSVWLNQILYGPLGQGERVWLGQDQKGL
jgi:hypothetical protein